METDKSAWFLSLKVGVARASVEKHKEQIWKLRDDMNSAFDKLLNIDVDSWRDEGRKLLNQMEDASCGLASMETNVAVSKVAGGTAAVLGGVFSVIALGSGATLPLVVAGAVIGTAGGFTSGGGELAKYSTFKTRLENLNKQYGIFAKETQYLHDVVSELLKLLKQAWQLINHIFGSFNVMQEEACKSLKLQESFPEQVWQDMDSLTSEGSVVLEAVGAIVVRDKEVTVTRIGMALRSLSKGHVDATGGLALSRPNGSLEDCVLHLNKMSVLKAGIFTIYLGAEVLSNAEQAAEDVPHGSVAMLRIGAGIWDVMKGVKSLHQGSHTAKALWQNFQQTKESISLLEEALEMVTRCIVG